MSKKPNKRCGAATGGHSPILAKLGEIRINRRAAKAANDEAGALARFYHEQFPLNPAAAVAAHNVKPQSEPRNTPSHFECKAAWLRENAPLYWPLVEIAADWKALKAEHDPLSERVGNAVGPPESDCEALLSMFDKQDDLMRRVEELLKAPPKSASCLYIKVGLLGIFAVYVERDWKADEEHCGYGGCHPSNDSLVDATFQLFEHLKTKTETPPDTVRFLIETIQESLI